MSVFVIVNKNTNAKAMVDHGCCTNCLVAEKLVRKLELKRTPIRPIEVEGVNGQKSVVDAITWFDLDIGGVRQRTAAYISQSTYEFDMIIGKTWLERHGGVIDAEKRTLTLKHYGITVRSAEDSTHHMYDPISAAAFQLHVRQQRRRPKAAVRVFAASLHDIEKALQPKEVLTDEQVRQKLPKHVLPYYELFLSQKADQLPPLRGQGVDHSIELVKEDGKTPEVPYGPLYSMTRDELLVLRRTLLDLLDKGFIRASSSPAGSPVLFVRKPGGGLRFCVDYRALNAIMKKDRYPLPLIKETLNQIGRAKWYTKLDVTAAFHKIRIKEGDEWMTAFRTRFGSYEWMVTPFGLANAPSTFQRYINWVLRDLLDETASAYLDDILIFTDGTLSQHHDDVRQVLKRLQDAGLYLELKKCEFDVRTTKYLGFILEAGKGIRMDPEKTQAIQNWQPPTTIKGVRGFLGFANFYRRFIPNFGRLADPLTQLTRKDTKFIWGEEQQQSFQQLKTAFLSDETLVAFDPDKRTVVECDSSGHALGGTLSQEQEDGTLRTVAYLSKKFNPHESNYPIHDKELLAVVRCLEEWDSELRGTKEFEVITDHKNLEYFTYKQKLTERHVRWSLFLSKFQQMKIRYRPGQANVRADALSRRDQDMPHEDTDERIVSREFIMLAPATLGKITVSSLQVPTLNEEGSILPTLQEAVPPLVRTIEERWDDAVKDDGVYQAVRAAVKLGSRTLPALVTKKLAISIGDCTLSQEEKLLWRQRLWAPEDEPLRTSIIQEAHLSVVTGHPGREETYRILATTWYWPGMSQDVRRYVRNCDSCRQSTSWRDGKQGFLRPLPVPNRTWQDLSVDFIVGLPPSSGYTNIMVVKDRLGKGVILVPMTLIEADDVAWTFVREVFRHHGLPRSIVSDRGTQFVSTLWGKVCQLLSIERKLSTAHHPQTDGGTERANSDLEALVRIFCNYDQNNWATLCPILELMMNSRTNTSTGVSPFFLQHGYHNTPFKDIEPDPPRTDPMDRATQGEERAESIVRVLQQASQWAIAAMTYSQQQQEEQANKHRKQAPRYQVGDWVWLDLRNVRTSRRSKKLDWKNAKFQITRVRDPYWVELNVPWQTTKYHVDKIRPAASDPFPSQQTAKDIPTPVVVRDENADEEHLEWKVEEIRDERIRQSRTEYQVKWKDWDQESDLTWEPQAYLEDTEALDLWKSRTAGARSHSGKLKRGWRQALSRSKAVQPHP
jgi:hypothetical protein